MKNHHEHNFEQCSTILLLVEARGRTRAVPLNNIYKVASLVVCNRLHVATGCGIICVKIIIYSLIIGLPSGSRFHVCSCVPHHTCRSVLEKSFSCPVAVQCSPSPVAEVSAHTVYILYNPSLPCMIQHCLVTVSATTQTTSSNRMP